MFKVYLEVSGNNIYMRIRGGGSIHENLRIRLINYLVECTSSSNNGHKNKNCSEIKRSV